MGERHRWWWSLSTIGVFAAVGIVDSVRAERWGVLGLFAVIELVAIGLAFSIRSRAPVPLRDDLATWLESTAAVTGESPGEIADRAVSRYRAAVHDERCD